MALEFENGDGRTRFVYNKVLTADKSGFTYGCWCAFRSVDKTVLYRHTFTSAVKGAGAHVPNTTGVLWFKSTHMSEKSKLYVNFMTRNAMRWMDEYQPALGTVPGA